MGRGVTRWVTHDLAGYGEDSDIYPERGGSCGGCEQRRRDLRPVCEGQAVAGEDRGGCSGLGW